MPLTNDERGALAIFAGWLYETNGNWMTKDGVSMPCYDWHPATDGRQILMVLEALVVHVGCKQGYSWENVLRDLMWKAHQCYEDEEDFNLGDAVCAAGLEILNQKGGG